MEKKKKKRKRSAPDANLIAPRWRKRKARKNSIIQDQRSGEIREHISVANCSPSFILVCAEKRRRRRRRRRASPFIALFFFQRGACADTQPTSTLPKILPSSSRGIPLLDSSSLPSVYKSTHSLLLPLLWTPNILNYSRH